MIERIERCLIRDKPFNPLSSWQNEKVAKFEVIALYTVKKGFYFLKIPVFVEA